MKSYSCFLPWPPSVNTYYSVYNGRKIMSKKGRQFKKDCVEFIHPTEKFTGPLSLNIIVNMPDKRRRDLDNLLKPILDVLGDYGVYEDDSQIDDLRITKDKSLARGETFITVREIGNC